MERIKVSVARIVKNLDKWQESECNPRNSKSGVWKHQLNIKFVEISKNRLRKGKEKAATLWLPTQSAVYVVLNKEENFYSHFILSTDSVRFIRTFYLYEKFRYFKLVVQATF